MFNLQDTRYNNIRLIFDPIPHKYKDTLSNDYISTTTLLGNLKEEFDRDYWLRKKSKELKISVKDLAKQWQDITDEACARGTKTHDNIEDSIKSISKFKDAVKHINHSNGSMITVADICNIDINVKQLDVEEFKYLTDNKYTEIYRIFQYYVDNGYKIYAELGTFLIDYLVSGMIDIVCIREDGFVIGDWKTNRGGLKFEAGYYKKDKSTIPNQTTDVWIPKAEYLLPPVNHLSKCNGSIYNLQLSMYAKTIEIILGIPCRGLWLAHIDSDFVLNKYGQPMRFPDGLYKVKDNPVEKVTLHKMKYLSKEIDMILEDRARIVSASKVTNYSLFENL